MESIKNAKEIFKKITQDYNYLDEMHIFYSKLSIMTPNEIDVDNLILAYKLVLSDYEKSTGTATHFFTNVPRKIRPYVSDEFYTNLWERYNKEILGIRLPEISEGKYSCIEIEPEVIDISMKDKNKVLAVLYNSSAPVGMGFAQYKPEPWDEEYAEMAFKYLAKELGDGTIYFDWVFGRPLRCFFKDNLVYVRNYNSNNAPNLAQRVISNIPDTYQKEVSSHKTKNRKN